MDQFAIDAAVLMVCFLGALISLLRVFSFVEPKMKSKLWLGPLVFLMPGALPRKGVISLIMFILFFVVGVSYFEMYIE